MNRFIPTLCVIGLFVCVLVLAVKLNNVQKQLDHYKYCAAIQGDINCDGKVNVQDLSRLSANWGGEK